jgi:beta-ureidopropionase / N-carbamoyl-L-amino-acid hydrolase
MVRRARRHQLDAGLTPVVAIVGERLLADLDALRRIGQDRTGVHRPALSDADLAARRWLAGRMGEIGLEPTIDGLGTVLGRSAASGPAVLVGSHTDSVPHGGWLDGALGVAYGLEIARAFKDDPATAHLAVDVVSFQDEEGTFYPCLGSRAFVGEIGPADVAACSDAGGRVVQDELARQGLAPAPWLRLEEGRYRAFLEAHIEQGPRLEQSGVAIGVATGIVGIRRFVVQAAGQADHAGTTPMAMRRDAGAAAIRLAARVLDEVAALAGPDTVWNLGKLTFAPGAANVVPAEAELWVEVRDPDAGRLEAIEARLYALVAAADGQGGVGVTARSLGAIPPVALDAGLVDLMEAAAGAAGLSTARMPSGAGHDAMILAPHVPSALLFIPSIGGRSHDVLENSHPADIVRGCAVLAQTARRVLLGA